MVTTIHNILNAVFGANPKLAAQLGTSSQMTRVKEQQEKKGFSCVVKQSKNQCLKTRILLAYIYVALMWS